VIHDEQDDGANTITLTPPNFSSYDQTLMDYLFYANIEHYDTEHDEYSFSVNGLSGKFFFDASGAAKVADHSNVKITKTGNTFTIVAGDGTTYYFGGDGLKVEKTRDVKTAGNPRAHKIKTMSWFLTKITSPEGDEINFTYSPIYTKTNQGPYQSVILKTLAPNYPTGSPFNEFPETCKPLCTGQLSAPNYTKIDYDTYFLSSINTSNGQQVYFTYQDRPDASGDNRLVYVNVYTNNNSNSSVAVKKYKLEYEDHPVGNDLNQRFLLKKIIQSTNETTPQTLMHEFQYNSPATLGSQESLLQDYYGYSKGNGYQPSNFFPRPVDYANYENGSAGIDRSPDFEATKAGTLKKVIYPTGGYEEFIYEPHTLAQNQYAESYTNSFTMNQYGGGSNQPPGDCDMSTYTHALNLTAPQVQISYTTEWNSSGPAPNTPGACNPDGIHFLSYLEIWDLLTNTRVFEARHKVYEGHNFTIQLEPGVPYEVRLMIKGLSTRSVASFQYNPVTQTTVTNVPACGLRVKQINAYDPLTDKTFTKYYKYASLQYPDRSSGIGVVRPSFESVYRGGGICFDITPPIVLGENIAECPEGLLQVSSSSVSGAFSFSGSPVGYTHVIETNDEQMSNGGVEHKFYAVNNPHMPGPVIGNDIAGAANTSAVPDMNGTELETKVFKKQGSAFILLKETKNVYGWDPRQAYSRPNYSVRKRWDPPVGGNFSYYDKLKGFDVNSYLHIRRWWHLNETTNTEYDQLGQNPLTTVTSYTYGNEHHLQATQVSTTNSNNETITQVMKYPADYPSTAPYPDMIGKNILTPVLESSSTNGADPVSKVQNVYASYTGAGSTVFYKPQTIKVASGNNPLENRLQYHQYDVEGNPLELSKEADQRIAYLWNYKKTYPVAETKNASANEIAYTSFEGDNDGNWNASVSRVSGGVTGKEYGSGSLSLSLTNTSKPYTVTLWAQGTATVNSTTGTLLTTKNGWSLYQWNLSAGTSSVTVSGNALDEVRLYPAGAQMTTYTYHPFIGISSTCDANNKTAYYFYDGFNRLALIKDADNNILKKVCYNYAGQAETCLATSNTICTNTAANWQDTETPPQCELNESGGRTGFLLQEQADMNPCSPTFGQTRWNNIGQDEEACPVVSNVTITATNTTGYAGFTAVYTLRSNGQTTTFTIPAGSGTHTLGSLPPGAYDLTISKTGNNVWLLFGSGCSYLSGLSATFTRINVSASNCKAITIDYDF
ncbi:MAG: hypothetical protein JNM19_06130, partial [Chitinophagaceae bacterium]|nr:hypothetical protein [Chitinophagaceae bacterium]